MSTEDCQSRAENKTPWFIFETYLKSVKQRKRFLRACSLLGYIDAIASLLSYLLRLLCKILASSAWFRPVSSGFAVTIYRL